MNTRRIFKSSISAFAVVAGLGLGAGTAMAGPVNTTGNVTPDVIFGSGNANGSWTGVNVDGVELALRGKLRYDLFGNPQNIFNYDGDHTYTFDKANSVAPANRSIFNFEFAINTDTTGMSGFGNLSLLTFLLEFDLDPSAGTTFLGFNPVTGINDNAYGNNTTTNGNGTDGTAGTSVALRLANNVAQNSENLGFGFTILDPQTPGIYTYNLSVFDPNSNDPTLALATTSIDIRVVPEPGTLALFGLGLVGLGFARRRKTA